MDREAVVASLQQLLLESSPSYGRHRIEEWVDETLAHPWLAHMLYHWVDAGLTHPDLWMFSKLTSGIAREVWQTLFHECIKGATIQLVDYNATIAVLRLQLADRSRVFRTSYLAIHSRFMWPLDSRVIALPQLPE